MTTMARDGAWPRWIVAVAALFFIPLATLACEDAADSEISVPPAAPAAHGVAVAVRVDNIANGETFRHSLAIVDGTAGGSSVTTKTLGATGAADAERAWPVVKGRFRALVPLRKGRNEVQLRANDGGRGDVVITYVPDDNPRFVRPVYVDAADGDGTFDAEGGEGRDVDSAKARIATAVWLLQAFTAEALHDEGFPRRSFRVPLDEQGRPVVEVFKSRLTMADAHAMDAGALWQALNAELATLPQRTSSIDLAVVAMTRYDAATRTAKAHAAHGGERLALFGSATLHTYAESLDHVVDALTDGRMLDPSTLFDDSGGRGKHWAAYATGMGAMLHELGHCFDLAHSNTGVMSRDFDHVHRKLALTEPDAAEVGFDRSAAVRLRYHPFIAATPARRSLTMKVEGKDVVLASPTTIRHVEVQLDNTSVHFEEPNQQRIQIAKPRERFSKPGSPTMTMRVTAIDDEGNAGVIDVP